MAIPVNISANVGLSGGAPNSPEDTAQYLTQLQQSLNGFTGSTAAALNYLLSVSNATNAVYQLILSFFGPNAYAMPDGPANPTATSGYTMGGMAFRNANGQSVTGSGSSGDIPVFIPSITGRVAIFGLFNWRPNMTQSGYNGSCNAILEYGIGSYVNAPTQGTAAPVGTQIGLGSVISVTVGDFQSFSNYPLAPMALLTGLSKTTNYWVDVGFSCSISNSGAGGTILGGTNGFLLIAEV